MHNINQNIQNSTTMNSSNTSPFIFNNLRSNVNLINYNSPSILHRNIINNNTNLTPLRQNNINSPLTQPILINSPANIISPLTRGFQQQTILSPSVSTKRPASDNLGSITKKKVLIKCLYYFINKKFIVRKFFIIFKSIKCFTCGGSDHSRNTSELCPSNTNFRLNNNIPQSQTTNNEVLCPHCGQVGHTRISHSDCLANKNKTNPTSSTKVNYYLFNLWSIV